MALPETTEDQGNGSSVAQSDARDVKSSGEGSAPVRVQLRRTKGWRLPPNTVKVDRTTRFGNPWRVDAYLCAYDAVESFRRFVEGPPWEDPHMAHTHKVFTDSLPALRGKNLACWCKPGEPCHADVLLELANAPLPSQPRDPQIERDESREDHNVG